MPPLPGPRRAALILVLLLAAPVLAALGLIASQPGGARTGEGGLDFARLPEAEGEPAPLLSYRAPNGDALGFRRYPAGRAQAPLLVLIHGSGWHGRYLDPLARRIAQAGLAKVVVPDLRGHGPDPIRRGDVDHIGQLEDDLHALIAQEGAGRAVVMGGHSSGGGLALRYAGGAHGAELDGAILLAPFLHHAAPTTRPGSGGWAQARVRRIIGLSMLNAVGITALNHLPVIDFAFPPEVLEGPLGDTATPRYSYRLNRSLAPRDDYLADAAALPPFLLAAGRADEAFAAEAYEPTLAPAAPGGRYVLLDGVSHLGLVAAEGSFAAIRAYLADRFP